MLLPKSHAWTRTQRWLIATSVLLGIVAFGALVYSYERYHRGPKDSVLVGTWRGEYLNALGDNRTGYRFKPDHTYEELLAEDPDCSFELGRDSPRIAQRQRGKMHIYREALGAWMNDP